jgi:hypothetical protein
MRGAIVFLTVFVILLVITLAYPGLPLGKQLYGMLGVPTTDYPVLGISATTLVIAVFNGVVYGIIAWLISHLQLEQESQRSQKLRSRPFCSSLYTNQVHFVFLCQHVLEEG